MMENNNIHKNRGLRKALANSEMKLPEMPVDLNEKVMMRTSAKPKRNRLVWPWFAAACVAGIATVLLMPPNKTDNISEVTQVAKQEPSGTKDSVVRITVADLTEPITTLAETKVPKVNKKTEVVIPPQQTETLPKEDTSPKPKPSDIVDEERKDVKITNPKNLEYTPEDLEKLKKKARQKYEEWIQLEREIMDATEKRVASTILEQDTTNINIQNSN